MPHAIIAIVLERNFNQNEYKLHHHKHHQQSSTIINNHQQSSSSSSSSSSSPASPVPCHNMITARKKDALPVIDHATADRRAAAHQLYGFWVSYSRDLIVHIANKINGITCHAAPGCGARSRRAIGQTRCEASGSWRGSGVRDGGGGEGGWG
jgi:hypothetical protein